MPAVQGSRGLNFSGQFDVSEILANQKKVIKGFGDMRAAAEQSVNNGGTSANFKASQIAFQNELKRGREELAKLKIEEQELRNTIVKNGVETSEYTKKIAANRLAQQELTRASRESREALKNVSGSYNEAQKRLTELGKSIKGAEGGFKRITPELRSQIKEYNTLNEKLKAFDARLGNHQRNVGNYKRALEGLRGFGASYLGATAILSGASQIIRANAEISDSLADVQRTTGLTAKEADNLATQLKKIDTRTSLKGLLDIAIIGGQLGIASDQLGGFTKAVDQLAVSLSGELQGGAEGIAKSLGVLDNVFSVSASNAGDVEKSYNQIGSAILGLGQSGLATGDYLTDFGERVGGLAKQAGLSLPVILSYGAVLQENGVSAEVAGSSFKRLLSALVTNRGKFLAVAQIADANLTLESFTNIINTDAKRALDLFFQGLSKGGTTTSGFNDILKSLKLTQGGVSQSIAALANNQQALNGHIRDSTRDFNEATIAAEQFEIKNNNLAGSLEKLGNFFTNVSSDPESGIGKFFKGIIDYLRISLEEFNNLVSSKSWNEFFNKLGNGSSKPFEINESIKSVSKRTDDNLLFLSGRSQFSGGLEGKLKDKGEKFAIDYLSKLKKTSDEAALAYKNFSDGIKDGSLSKGFEGDLENIKNVSERAKQYYERVLKANKNLGFQLKENKKNTTDKPLVTDTRLSEAKKLETALDAQRRLQAEIDSLTKKGRAKRLSDDEQDLVDIDEKYAKLRDKAIAFNKSIKYKGLKVDTGGLALAQDQERSAKIDENKAKSLKDELEREKQQYADFEQYKVDFGITKAKEKYAALIDVDRTYLERIRDRESKLLGDDKAKGGDAGGGEYAKEQLRVLQEASDEAVKIEGKRTDALLKEFMGYADKRKLLTEEYESDIKLLENNPSAQGERKKRYDKDLKELDDANSDKLESYEKLFIGIEKLSTRNALRSVQEARKLLAKEIKDGILKPDEIKEINDLLNRTELEIRNKSGQALIDLGSAIDNVANSVGELDAAFGKVLGTVGSIVGQLGNVKKGFADFNTAKAGGDTLGELGAGLGIFGAGLSIFKSVIGLFDKSQQREEQAAYARDLQNKQTEALNKALERQVALLNDVYGTDRIRDYSAAIKQAQDNQAKYASELQGKYALSGDKELDDILTKINNGEGTGIFGLSPESFIKKNQAALDKLKLPKDLEALQRLSDENKLDANTKTILDNLIKARDAAIELQNALDATKTGTTLDQIADDFITTLTDGTQNFGKTFEETIQKSILNGFKGEIIRKQLQAFYSQFAELSEGGLTSSEIDTLRKSYLNASEKAKEDLEALSKATGIDLTSGNKGQSNSLKGSIAASLTEETGGILASVFKGVQVSTLSIDKKMTPLVNNSAIMINIATDTLNGIVAVGNNTLRTANNTDRLANIELALASMDSKIQRGSNYNSILSGSGTNVI